MVDSTQFSSPELWSSGVAAALSEVPFCQRSVLVDSAYFSVFLRTHSGILTARLISKHLYLLSGSSLIELNEQRCAIE
jgi:hypothetical protein